MCAMTRFGSWSAYNGIGVAAEQLDHLFDPYFRVIAAESRNVSGTGLGLALVKNFVQLMGGTVRASSVLGQGSEFIVEIPRHLSAPRIQTSTTTSLSIKFAIGLFQTEDVERIAMMIKLPESMPRDSKGAYAHLGTVTTPTLHDLESIVPSQWRVRAPIRAWPMSTETILSRIAVAEWSGRN